MRRGCVVGTAAAALVCVWWLVAALRGGEEPLPLPPTPAPRSTPSPPARPPPPPRTPSPEVVHFEHNGTAAKHPDELVDAGSLQWVSEGPEDAYGGAAYVFRNVCVSYNRDNAIEHTERGLIMLTGKGGQLNCVPCFNPVVTLKWDAEVRPQNARCGMHWVHKVTAPGLRELGSCWRRSEEQMQQWGQRQAPARPRRAAIWRRRTLLLLYHSFNIGHQLFDSVLAVAAVLAGDEPPPHLAISHQDPGCPQRNFFCSLLRRHGWLTDDRLLPFDPAADQLPCFSELVVPKYGIGRISGAAPNYPSIRLLREALQPSTPSAGVPSGIVNLALYGRGDAFRRRWLDVEEVAAEAAKRLNPSCRLEHVRAVSGMSFAEQAQLFQRSPYLLLAHGAVAANAFYARPGTTLLEVACEPYSHLATYDKGRLLREWQLKHVIAHATKCRKTPDRIRQSGADTLDQGRADYDFFFSFADVLEHMPELQQFLLQ